MHLDANILGPGMGLQFDAHYLRRNCPCHAERHFKEMDDRQREQITWQREEICRYREEIERERHERDKVS